MERSAGRMVAYWEPKSGTPRSDWEDGCAYNPITGWFAVADGASTGSSSREWAHTLTRRFVADQPHRLIGAATAGCADVRRPFSEWLSSVQEEFDPTSSEYTQSAVPEWVRSAGERRGSFATFVGGCVSQNRWSAVAFGDSCLFHVSDGRLRRSFPLKSASEFGSTPDLLASARMGADALGGLRQIDGELNSGDSLFVATDALSEWILRQGSSDVFGLLARIGHEGFGDLCADLWERGEMKNDDVTMFRYVHAPSAETVTRSEKGPDR